MKRNENILTLAYMLEEIEEVLGEIAEEVDDATFESLVGVNEKLVLLIHDIFAIASGKTINETQLEENEEEIKIINTGEATDDIFNSFLRKSFKLDNIETEPVLYTPSPMKESKYTYVNPNERAKKDKMKLAEEIKSGGMQNWRDIVDTNSGENLASMVKINKSNGAPSGSIDNILAGF